MKTNIFNRLVILSVLTISLAACSDSFLDLKDPNKSSEADFWKNEADAQAALATVYSPIRGQMYGYFGAFTGWHNQNARADDTFTLLDDSETWKVANFIYTSQTGRIDDDFESLYQCIQRANVYRENIDNVPGMTDEKKRELKAEATFLRGLAYFFLVINWGEVPLHETSITEPEEAYVNSSSEEKIWELIIGDFKYAKEYLPITREKEEAGRVTRGAAIAYLGKAYVYTENFVDAEKELSIIMTAPYEYDLVNNPSDNFSEYEELNKESIFELVYANFGDGSWGSEESTSTMGMVLPNFIGPPATDGWFKVMPTASLIDEFTTELRPAGADTKFDKRMYSSFYFKYSDYDDVKLDEIWYGEQTFDSLWISTDTKRTVGGAPNFSQIEGKPGRFLYKKYTNWWSTDKKGNSMYEMKNQQNNYRVMRFAEVLLLHAEACIKNGNIGGATTDLHRIRDRAGLARKTWANTDDLMEEVKKTKVA